MLFRSAQVARQAPGGVSCVLSALRVLALATQIPFAVWLAPDLGKVARAVRLPWKAGGVCGVEADATGLYLAGRGGPNLAALGECKDVTAPQAKPAEPGTRVVGSKVFVVKLTPQGEKIMWARQFADKIKVTGSFKDRPVFFPQRFTPLLMI